MKRIGLVDVDGHSKVKKWGTAFPNLALMKISAYHKSLGDEVEWAVPLAHYDDIYMSKVFSSSIEPNVIYNASRIHRGGSGYDLHTELPTEIDRMTPDYSIYPWISPREAYGFLTRGCPNKCKWCVVPIKEGAIRPYMDVDEIAVNGRDHLILMDNNILGCQYGIEQIEKIIDRKLWVDFNQAMDARLVTPEIAKLLAKVKWHPYVRFGCDTKAQIEPCQKAADLMQSFGYKGMFMFYCLLTDNFEESFNRVEYWRNELLITNRHYPHVQPFLDFNDPKYVPPRWQKDMARWCGMKSVLKKCRFEDYEPRKGFYCKTYFEHPETIKFKTQDEINEYLFRLR